MVEVTQEELQEVLERLRKSNFISVNGLTIHSSTESLKEIEKTAVRLLDRYQDFLLMRKELNLKTGSS